MSFQLLYGFNTRRGILKPEERYGLVRQHRILYWWVNWIHSLVSLHWTGFTLRLGINLFVRWLRYTAFPVNAISVNTAVKRHIDNNALLDRIPALIYLHWTAFNFSLFNWTGFTLSLSTNYFTFSTLTVRLVYHVCTTRCAYIYASVWLLFTYGICWCSACTAPSVLFVYSVSILCPSALFLSLVCPVYVLYTLWSKGAWKNHLWF